MIRIQKEQKQTLTLIKSLSVVLQIARKTQVPSKV